MEYLSLFLFFSIAAPLSMTLILCRGRTRSFLTFIICGLVIALFAGELNAIVIRLLPFSQAFCIKNITPITEEICKALPILFYAFEYRPSRQELLENSIAVGVGFAILENAFIFASSAGVVSIVTAIMRGFGAGLMHGISTCMIGFGMSFVHIKKKIFYSGTTALLAVAIIYHSMYNSLVSSGHIVLGLLLTVLTVCGGYFGLRKNKFI